MSCDFSIAVKLTLLLIDACNRNSSVQCMISHYVNSYILFQGQCISLREPCPQLELCHLWRHCFVTTVWIHLPMCPRNCPNLQAACKSLLTFLMVVIKSVAF